MNDVAIVYEIFSTKEASNITGLSHDELEALDESNIAKCGADGWYDWLQLRRLHQVKKLLDNGARPEGKPCPVVVLVPKVSDNARAEALILVRKAMDLEDRVATKRMAEDLYVRAITLNPGFTPSYVQLGRLLCIRGKTSDAEVLWKKALSLDPYQAAASYNLAHLNRERKEYATALEYAERSIVANGDWADAHWMVAECSMALGQKERAREAWVMYIRLSDDERLKRDAWVKVTKLAAT